MKMKIYSCNFYNIKWRKKGSDEVNKYELLAPDKETAMFRFLENIVKENKDVASRNQIIIINIRKN